MPTYGETHSLLAPFRLPIFRELWAGNVLSTIGGYINDVAAAWLMTSLSASPLMVSLIQVAANLPFFIISLPGGALGDVVDRRKLLLTTQIWMMLLSVVLGVLTLMGRMSPVALLLITFMVEVADALGSPTWQAIIPEMVGSSDVRAAITLNSVGINVARAIGPALGGLLIVLAASSAPSFFINAASFFLVIVVLWRWKHRAVVSGLPAERFMGAMKIGIRYVRYAPRFRATLVRIGAFAFFSSAVAALLPVIARAGLHRGAGAYGILLGCMGVGAVASVPILERVRRKMKVDVLLAIATVLAGGVELALGNVRVFPILCGVMLVAGVSWVTTMSFLNSAAQSGLPSWVRARAMSVYLLVFFGALAAGSAVWGAVASRAGTPEALTIAACGMLGSLMLIPRFRIADHEKLDLTPSLHWAAPVIEQYVGDERGPVLITVEYRVSQKHAADFLKLMKRLRLQRLRTGAFQWGIFNDAADSTRYIETFLSESWTEHMRQHGRITKLDQEVEKAVASLLLGTEPPIITHLVHCDMKSVSG
jgi:MFS family permease